jgi:hypothetical protein
LKELWGIKLVKDEIDERLGLAPSRKEVGVWIVQAIDGIVY